MITDEWIRESMPPHWSIARVKDHARIINGYPFDSKLFAADTGYPLVRIRDISSSETVVRYDGDWIPEAAISTGDILVGMDGEFNIARWSGGDALLNQRVCCIRTTENIDPGYLYYALPAPLRLINEFTYSTTVKHLSSFDILDIRVPYPPIEQQELIANYLDRETARIDGLIAEKERMLALLEEKRAALISRVVTRGLDPNAPLKPSNAPWFDKTPTAWSVERLKWIIQSVSSGVSVNASDQPVEGDGFGVLKTSAVAGGAFLPGENKSVWDTEYERLACPVTRDTIIMSRMNTPNLVGESGYVAEDYPNLYLPDRLWQISFDASRVFVPFMSLLLASKEARHALSAMATGTSPSMKNLAIEEMASLLVPVPSLEEQKAIYEEVARREATIAPLKNELANSLLLLKERRAALITAAVTGQIPLEEMTG